MTSDTATAIAATIFAVLTWLLALSYKLGASNQRIVALEAASANTETLLNQIWCEIRRIGTETDRLIGMHQRDNAPGDRP